MIWLTIVLSTACAPLVPTSTTGQVSDRNLYVYLQPLPQEAQRLTLTLRALRAHNKDGGAASLASHPVILDPSLRMGNQSLLLSTTLPPGRYTGLSYSVAEAVIETEDGPMTLLTDETPVELRQEFEVGEGRNVTLFMALEPDRLVTDGYRLTARFSLWKPQPVLPEFKGLVAHPMSGIVTLFDKVTPAVVAVLHVGRSPAGIAVDQPIRRAYIALSGEDSIAAIDLVQERILRTTRLRLADRPTRLTLSTDGLTLSVLNSGSNSVSILDSGSFQERSRIILSSRPTDLFSARERLVAYLLLPEANTLSVIDLERGEQTAAVTLPESPYRGVVSADDRSLFLLTETVPYLLILDARTLTVRSRVFIGGRARCLTVNREGREVYVGTEDGTVVIIDPSLELPIDSFHVGGPVVDLVHDVEENSLLVLTETAHGFEKYDPVSHKRLDILELADVGGELAVMGE